MHDRDVEDVKLPDLGIAIVGRVEWDLPVNKSKAYRNSEETGFGGEGLRNLISKGLIGVDDAVRHHQQWGVLFRRRRGSLASSIKYK